MKRFAAIPLHYQLVAIVGMIMLAKTLGLVWQGLSYPGVTLAFADKDFANYWTAARLVFAGGTSDLFGPHAGYFRHLTDAFGPDYPWHNWSYPPHFLLMIWPLGLLGYKAAMMVFLGTSGLFFLWAARRFAGGGSALLWIAVLPFVAHNIWVAQNGFLFAGLGLGALALRAERPVLAGFMLGLLTVKPQLGFLFPFLLLFERRWLVIASATVTTVVLVALSAAIFGVDAWRGYLSEVLPYQTFVMRELDGTFLSMLPSVYGMLRNWGLGADAALALHLVAAIPVALVTILAFGVIRRKRDRAVLLLVSVFLITPYALTYDLGLLAVAAGVTALRVPVSDRANGLWLALAMLLPVVMMPLGALWLSIAPLVIAANWLIVLRQGRAASRLSALWRLKRGAPRFAPAVPA